MATEAEISHGDSCYAGERVCSTCGNCGLLRPAAHMAMDAMHCWTTGSRIDLDLCREVRGDLCGACLAYVALGQALAKISNGS